MNRRSLSVAAALAATATLLLTACGGGDDGSPDRIEGADKKASSSPSPDAPSGAGRPEIKLPKSFEMSFEDWTDGDPKKQAVLNDGKERLRGVHAAIIDNDPQAEYLRFYSSDVAAETSRTYIKGYTDKDLTLIGKARISDPEVTLLDKKRATLFYCVDEGKGYTKDRKTGDVEGTPKNVNPHVHYVTSLQKSAHGVWKTRSVEAKRGGC
ncbi:hypothetical protein [Streptomyces sp. NPDC047108]|uniref:hypothetical protein n=1 Tax=Streptomyces sp. NPDC047108 TaxID=3155025 RepID=UPI0033D15C1E